FTGTRAEAFALAGLATVLALEHPRQQRQGTPTRLACMPLVVLQRLCRKVAFETIGAMVSPGNLRCPERENDDGDQFQGSPLSARYYSDWCAVVCRLSLELPAWRRAHAGTWCASRPRHHSAVGGAI